MKINVLRNKSLLYKMIFGIILLLIPAIVLPTVITAIIFSRDMYRRSEKQTINSFMESEIKISKLLFSMNSAAYLLQNDPSISDCLFAEHLSESEMLTSRINADKAFNSLFQSYDYIGGVLFKKQDGTIFGATRRWNFTSDMPSAQMRGYLDANSKYLSSNFTWIDTHPQQYFTSYSKYTSPTLSDMMVFGIKSYPYEYSYSKDEKQLVIIAALTEDSIRACFEQIENDYSSVILLDTSGYPLSTKDLSLYGKIPAYFYKIDRSRDYDSFVYTADNGTENQIVYYMMENTGWILAKITPKSYYTDNIRTLLVTAAIIGVLIIIITCVLIIFWSKKLYRPIFQMTTSIRRIRDGDLSIRLQENSDSSEFALLQRQINKMLDSINDLLLQKEKDEKEKLMLEMRSLQVQITPHFIYNALASIRWKATISGAASISEMLISLTNLLKPVFSEWKPDWTIKEELEFIDNYINLMRLRHNNMISIGINVDENIDNCLVPRFILQPLLENCCEHTNVNERYLNIAVNIIVENNDMMIEIIDDGEGISPEKLSLLKKNLLDNDTNPVSHGPYSGIGLVNIHRRIKLYYGSKYGLSIDSVLGKGTCASIRLEVKRKTLSISAKTDEKVELFHIDDSGKGQLF